MKPFSLTAVLLAALCAFLTASLLLAACQPPLSAAPQPPPRLLNIQLTPALSPWRDALHTCAARQPEIGLEIAIVPAQGADSARDAPAGADALLRFGPPPNLPSYSAILGYDELIPILHPSNPSASLTLLTLSRLYSGASATWGDLLSEGLTLKPSPPSGFEKTPIQTWAYPPGEDLRLAFEGALDIHTSSIVGAQARPPHLAPDAAAMLEAISQNPGSAGYILQSDLDRLAGPEVIKMPIVGGPPASFRQPILAITPTEPQGDLRQLLLCLQKR